MQCKFCGFANGEEDHRCLRCGRRLEGVVVAAPPGYTAGYSGANALAPAPSRDTRERPLNDSWEAPAPRDGQPAAAPRQATLFSAPADQKVIPFDAIQRQASRLAGAAPAAAQSGDAVRPAPAQSQTQSRRPAAPSAAQANFDFQSDAPAQRTLRTDVPAQVYCEQPVATPMHRSIAGAIDAAMILVGFGGFLLGANLTGAEMGVGVGFGEGKLFWGGLGASFVLLAFFYGLIFAMKGRVTTGMDLTHLHLITFDGFPLDRKSRTVRFATTWLSVLSGGLGLVWAVADEENLTWHDHISKTFPTFREAPGGFVRRRSAG